MAKFESVRVSKISDSIVSQLERLILEGTLKPGERLPPERELAEQLGVSRPSLREAVVIMESRGLLEAKRGGGTFVRDIVAPTLTDPLVHLMQTRPSTTFDVLELRHALEEVAAYYAAERATDDDRSIIERHYEELRAAYATSSSHNVTEAKAAADTEFHMAIAEASHNIALVHVMRGLFNLLRIDITKNLERLSCDSENHQILENQHAAIYQAVMEGDTDKARDAAHTHLAFVDATLRELADEEIRKKRARRRLRHSDD